MASHGTDHQLVFEQTSDQFEEDLVRSKELILKAVGVETRAYRAPGFSISSEQSWVFDILVQNGFQYRCLYISGFQGPWRLAEFSLFSALHYKNKEWVRYGSSL